MGQQSADLKFEEKTVGASALHSAKISTCCCFNNNINEYE